MSSTNMCQICNEATQKYNCPRCGIQYCSVACYRSQIHNNCSEEFYKECVVQEMALQSQHRCGTLDDIPGLSDDVKRMYQMLKRMESNQSISSNISDFDISEEELDSDDEQEQTGEVTDLHQRLEGINLDDADAIWAKLTDSERQEFGKIVRSEDVSAILPTFNPWWENKVQKVMIEEMNGEEHDGTIEYESTLEFPKISESIVDFAQISTKAPAPCVDHNLVNVIAAYTSTVRFFCGEHFSSPHEAVNYLLSICANLKTNANSEEQSLAIESVRYESHAEGLSIDGDDVHQMKKDIDNINEGPDPLKVTNVYILAALSDLHRLLTAAKCEKKSPMRKTSTSMSPQQSSPQQNTKEFGEFVKRFGDHKIIDFLSFDKTKLVASIKKVEYYLAYVKKFRC